MGNLNTFDISGIIAKYNTKHLIETGTGGGTGVAFATQHPFDSIQSVEIIPLLKRNAEELFSTQPKVTIHGGDSVTTLPKMLEHIPQTEPILFWLDGHYPGADYGLGQYRKEDIPLEAELRVIRSLRPDAKDVFLIDDLRIYLIGDYENGNSWIGAIGNIDFIHELFQTTHHIGFSQKHEGYITLYPIE